MMLLNLIVEAAYPRAVLRRAVGVLAWLAAGGGLVWAVLRESGADRGFPFTQLVVLTPYVTGLLIVVAVLAVLARRWPPAAAVAVVAALLTAAVLPRALPGPAGPAAAEGGTVLRVVSVNTSFGDTDAATVVELVGQHDADVLSVQELTDEFARRLDAAGLERLLPHRILEPRSGAAGTGLYARVPLTDGRLLSTDSVFAQVRATARFDGRDVELVAVHIAAPLPRLLEPAWARELEALPAAPSAQDEPVRLLVGDFNATLDHSLLRRVIRTGYVDGADAVGAGLTPTWPRIPGFPFPGVALDHVLAGPPERVAFRSIDVRDQPDSDHRALLAELVLR